MGRPTSKGRKRQGGEEGTEGKGRAGEEERGGRERRGGQGRAERGRVSGFSSEPTWQP